MKKNVELKTKTFEEVTYIAKDGQTFADEDACLKHERDLTLAEKLDQLEHLLVRTKEDSRWVEDAPCNGDENMAHHIYTWYRVENKEQADLIDEVFYTDLSLTNYPEIVCIERNDDSDYDGYSCTLSGCKKNVEQLFSKFGYKVTFEKE